MTKNTRFNNTATPCKSITVNTSIMSIKNDQVTFEGDSSISV